MSAAWWVLARNESGKQSNIITELKCPATVFVIDCLPTLGHRLPARLIQLLVPIGLLSHTEYMSVGYALCHVPSMGIYWIRIVYKPGWCYSFSICDVPEICTELERFRVIKTYLLWQGWTDTVCQVALATVFYTVAPNIFFCIVIVLFQKCVSFRMHQAESTRWQWGYRSLQNFWPSLCYYFHVALLAPIIL